MDPRITEYASDILASSSFISEKWHTHHIYSTIYSHCINVAEIALSMLDYSRFLRERISERSLVRAALLHDYFLNDRYTGKGIKWNAFRHPKIAMNNAIRDFGLTDYEKDAVLHHMWPLTPKPPVHLLGWVISFADKAAALSELLGKRKMEGKANGLFSRRNEIPRSLQRRT